MVEFIKKFLEWMRVKKTLDAIESEPPLFREGEIWWCAMGENIGTEISGKNIPFSRPVVILKKYGRQSFFAIPMTSKKKEGSWFVQITQAGKSNSAIVSQGRYCDYRRLYRKIGMLDEDDYKRVKNSFIQLHK